MGTLTIGVVGVLAVVLITTLAPRIGVASPLILVVVGIGVSLLPMVGVIEIEPELLLGGILPPLLYSAAVNTPTMEFRRDLRTISVFAVLLVVASAFGVGFLLTWLVPGLPLPIGIAVGAIVSPTDAVATTIVRKAGVSSRIVTVLEGEALFNDASSLVILRSAVAAVSASVTFWSVALDFVYAVVVAVVIGYLVGMAHILVRSKVPNIAASVSLSLVIPFVAYVPAEHLHASGLVAAVIAGLVTGQHTPERLSAEVRIAESAVWRTAELLLESAVFLLMGLQLYGLLKDVHESSGSFAGTLQWEAVGLGVAAATVVMVVRAGFVSASVWALARRNRRMAPWRDRLEQFSERIDSMELPQRPGHKVDQRRWNSFKDVIAKRGADLDYLAREEFGWKDGVILVAAGMRGAVTLAAAQSLPTATPYRSLLVLTAFVVAAGTLLVQGGTLSRVVGWLNIAERDCSHDDELRAQLQTELAAAALAKLDGGACKRPNGEPFDEETLAEARKVLQTVIDPGEVLAEQAEDLLAVRLEIVEAQRVALLKIRDRGTYPTELLDNKLAQLDAEQIGIELRGS
ncbi:MAG: cation:proton antiporter [Propionibacteriaceae bacterium]|jgi:CPA1 family monovalent cation:H+ antiporter|nr:cation:proton antiporter [Propionibacteriaceae bacterium]